MYLMRYCDHRNGERGSRALRNELEAAALAFVYT